MRLFLLMSSTERVKKFLEELKDDNIRFKEHFYEKTKERPISEGMVREYVKKAELLLRAE